MQAYDAVVIVHPCFPFGGKWSFNPSFTLGAGDSDFTYELQPVFAYTFNERWAGRVGYRYLHYEVDGDHGEFDGSFSGAIFGIGVTW